MPKEGNRILLTWLPNPRNNPLDKSIYIGCSSIVKDLYNNGFILDMGGGLLIVNKKFRFKRLEN